MPSGNSFPFHQGGLRSFPDFVQHKAVKGFVLHTVLGTVLFPIGILGLTGINLLRVLVVGVADSQDVYKRQAQILNVLADGYMLGWSLICCQ